MMLFEYIFTMSIKTWKDSIIWLVCMCVIINTQVWFISYLINKHNESNYKSMLKADIHCRDWLASYDWNGDPSFLFRSRCEYGTPISMMRVYDYVDSLPNPYRALYLHHYVQYSENSMSCNDSWCMQN